MDKELPTDDKDLVDKVEVFGPEHKINLETATIQDMQRYYKHLKALAMREKLRRRIIKLETDLKQR